MKKGAAFLASQGQQNDTQIFVILFSAVMSFFREKVSFKKGAGGKILLGIRKTPVRIRAVALKHP